MSLYRKAKSKFSFSQSIIYVVISLFSIFCLIPFVVILSASFSNEDTLINTGYGLWPQKFSILAYKIVFTGSFNVFNSYMVTIIVTVTGTLASIFLTTLLAYPLSRKKYKYRNLINFYLFFTMLFNGGIVPWYILCTRYLGLKNNIPALIIPYLLNAWYVFLLRNFFSTIPESIEESARIDGAGDYRILFRIIVPLSLPGIATVALFTTLMYWNDWWLALMLINGNKTVPLQLYLIRIIQTAEALRQEFNPSMRQIKIPSETVRMAICIIAIGPIVFAYPFFQRFIIKGLIVGSIKG